MSNGDLQNRTRAALAGDSVGIAGLRALLHEWMKDAPLIGNLARSRALNGRLMDDQKHLIGALQVGIQQAERYPEDGPMKTFKAIALKRIRGAVQCP